MEQPDLELQLKVWKELAISKQVLMQSATKALGLKTECSTEELEDALNKTVNQAKNAESDLHEAQEKARTEISVLEAKLAKSEQATSEALTGKEEALAAHQSAEQKRLEAKAIGADELKKLKTQLAEKQKEIKQITKVLADTPENVVKKMKSLKKEKMDEANDRKRAEEVSRKLRKEKQRSEQKLKESEVALEQANKLAEDYRELHKFANDQFNQLAEKAEDKQSLEQVPVLNEQALESLEAATPKEKDKESA